MYKPLIVHEYSTSLTNTLFKRICDLCIRFGDFELSSGQKSNYYFDKFALWQDPNVIREVTSELIHYTTFQDSILVGIDMGTVPLAGYAAMKFNRQVIFARQEAKKYGLKNIFEGCKYIEGNRFTILEDVLTTGTAVKRTYDNLMLQGAEKIECVAILQRSKELFMPLPTTVLYQLEDRYTGVE